MTPSQTSRPFVLLLALVALVALGAATVNAGASSAPAPGGEASAIFPPPSLTGASASDRASETHSVTGVGLVPPVAAWHLRRRGVGTRTPRVAMGDRHRHGLQPRRDCRSQRPHGWLHPRRRHQRAVRDWPAARRPRPVPTTGHCPVERLVGACPRC